ncbi:unnamed protein product [Cuscuta campestris]|uniref:Transcription factor MYC/MYB N-terminal domain-containing protein n=1 Tax=Cuscuta campestris TaxID=132261 RepID=A0A484MFP4_9ASTE|nr:unnamed protein product [Cuscuta campestris]
MEEQLSSLAVTHLLQHTLRSLCIHENSQWVYAVFWRILPRNYPPPKWDTQGSAYDRSRGNRRNWILVWEDGFCNFAAAAAEECAAAGGQQAAAYDNNYQEQQQYHQGLQPELFFKMSHEIYNYGEGIIGKVAADHSHKWIYNKEPNDDQEISFLSAWHTSADSHPRTWEAQFRSGIKTIALIAVREGVIQLGAVHKVVEDLSYVVLLRKKFNYIESIPGVLLPHPSSSGYPMRTDGGGYGQEPWPPSHFLAGPPSEYYDHHHHFNQSPPAAMVKMVTPSMTSLEALLSKLPSVVPATSSGNYSDAALPPHYLAASGGGIGRPPEMVAKEEYDEGEYEDNNNNYEDNMNNCKDVGESSSSMSYNHHHHHHHNYGYRYDLNVRDYN